MLRLRQVCLAARDLDTVVVDLCAVLGIEVAFRDPGVELFGLKNAVMPVGTQFLEVVSPIRDGTTAGRFLERRGGDTGYMAIFETGDLAADRRRLEQLAVRVVWQADLDDIASVHLHPRDVGGAIVSLDQPRPAGAWRWGGPDWQRHVHVNVVNEIRAVTLEAAEPEALARRWAQVLGVSAARTGPIEAGQSAAVHQLDIDGGSLRFVPAAERGDGIDAIELTAVDRPRALAVAAERKLPTRGGAVSIGGVWLELR